MFQYETHETSANFSKLAALNIGGFLLTVTLGIVVKRVVKITSFSLCEMSYCLVKFWENLSFLFFRTEEAFQLRGKRLQTR